MINNYLGVYLIISFFYLNCHFVAIKDSDNNDRANLKFFFRRLAGFG